MDPRTGLPLATTRDPNMVANLHTPNIVMNPPTPALPLYVKLKKFADLTEDTYEQWACTAKANLTIGGYGLSSAAKKKTHSGFR
jgi:hypothetical protein